MERNWVGQKREQNIGLIFDIVYNIMLILVTKSLAYATWKENPDLDLLCQRENYLLSYEHLLLIWRESWIFFGSLERNHAKREAHEKNSKIFITVFNQILVSTGANHSVGEVWLLTGLQNAGGERMVDMIHWHWPQKNLKLDVVQECYI
jgi:hypothetical protein